MSAAGPLTIVTAVVADLDAALSVYQGGVGLHRVDDGRVPFDLAHAWRRPALAGRRWAMLAGPGDNRPGALRVIELPGVIAPAPLTTLGWAAAELVVADADAAAVRAERAGMPIIAEPAPVGTGGGLRAGQVGGPAGEALYLTEVTQAPPGFDLPQAVVPVGRIFIAVLASADLPRSRGLLERELQARRVTDHRLAVRALNAAFGCAPDTLHRVSSVQLSGASAIETDQYPRSAGCRPRTDGITGGIIAATVRTGGAVRVLDVPAAGDALLECE